MESNKKPSLGTNEANNQIAKGKPSAGRRPLRHILLRGAAVLLAMAMIMVGVAAAAGTSELSARAAEVEPEQSEPVTPPRGSGWEKVDVAEALAAFRYQPERAAQSYYSIGIRDEQALVAVHNRLMELGYMDADEPSALYGETTEQAVKMFERKNGFEMDGILTQYEYQLLMSDMAAKYSVSLGDEGVDVSELQRRLVELGFLEEVSGEFGIFTQTAVKAFQKENSLTADGTIGSETREMLYSEEAKGKALSYGDQADVLKTYQQRLKELGYYDGSVDGFFGSGMQQAVKEFQNKHGLIADGSIGGTTASMLLSDEAKPSAYSLGDSSDMVRRIQGRLQALGYMSSVTGYYGEHTETAVKQFQIQNGLSADGKVGARTMEVLFSDGAKKYGTQTAPAGNGNQAQNSASGGSGNSASNSSNSSNNNSNNTNANNSQGGGDASSGTSGGSGSSESANTPPAGNPASGSADSSKVNQLIEVAKSKLGCKYVLGAKGPDTFDCSGYIYWCLKEVGVSQSYMTSSGWMATTKYPIVTSMNELEAGDIISYDGHVGIYIGGNQMIDASSAEGQVRITNIYGVSYWRTHFIKGCRIF